MRNFLPHTVVSPKSVRTSSTVEDLLAGRQPDLQRSNLAILQAQLRGATTNEMHGRKAGRLFDLLRRLVATVTVLTDYQVEVTHWMALTKSRSARAAIEEEHARLFRFGAIGSWVPGALVWVLLLIFITFDVPYLNTVIRGLLDIPDSVAWWDVRSMSNLAALALSGALSVIALVSIAVGAKTWAFLAYRRNLPSYDRGRDADEQTMLVTAPRAELERHIRVWVKAALSVAGIAFVSVVLHQISTARFSAALFSSSGTLGSTTLIWLATLLPTMAYLMSIISESPRFAHVRTVHRAALLQGWRRWQSLRREARLRRRVAHQYSRFERRFDTMMSLLRHTDLTVLWEVLNAALAGTLDLTTNTHSSGYDTIELSRGRRWATSGQAETVGLSSPFRPTHLISRIQFLFSQLMSPGGSVLIEHWLQFHQDPTNYRPLNAATHTAIPAANDMAPKTTGEMATSDTAPSADAAAATQLADGEDDDNHVLPFPTQSGRDQDQPA